MKALGKIALSATLLGMLLIPTQVVEAKSKTTKTSPTAICRDGTISYSKHRSGTCSGHKGVRKWLK